MTESVTIDAAETACPDGALESAAVLIMLDEPLCTNTRGDDARSPQLSLAACLKHSRALCSRGI